MGVLFLVPLSVGGTRQLLRQMIWLASCRPRHTLRLPLTPPLAADKLAAGISPPVDPVRNKNMGCPSGASHILVPLTGIEPVRILLRGILSPLCLPVPPQRHIQFLRTCGPWCRCPFAVPGSRCA